MITRPIIHVPDPRLKSLCDPVDKIDTELHELLDEMMESMQAANGLGLAAIQIGVPKRVVVMDLSKEDEPPQPLYFINPEITAVSQETKTFEEGCLSIPDVYEIVERPAKVQASYLDRDGTRREIEADGLLAVCLQHEIDHLNGVLFIDYLSKLKRNMAIRKVQKADRARAKA